MTRRGHIGTDFGKATGFREYKEIMLVNVVAFI